MAKFINHEGGFAFEAEGQTIPLTEDNTIAYLHREDEWESHDMVGIQDPSDEMWWTWFRAQYLDDQETFEQMLGIAQMVGTCLLRDTALVETQEKFNNKFRFTDDDFNALLEPQDE